MRRELGGALLGVTAALGTMATGAAAQAPIEAATKIARQHAEAMAKGLGGQHGPVTKHHIAALNNGIDYSTMQGFPLPQMYDQQSRPLPDTFQSIQVTGTWTFVSSR